MKLRATSLLLLTVVASAVGCATNVALDWRGGSPTPTPDGPGGFSFVSVRQVMALTPTATTGDLEVVWGMRIPGTYSFQVMKDGALWGTATTGTSSTITGVPVG